MLKDRTVYIISSCQTPKVYIGSTHRDLITRFTEHRRPYNLTLSREITKYDDVKISPLCIIKNCTKSEIELKEKDYQLMMKDILVNKYGLMGKREPGYKTPDRINGTEKIKLAKGSYCEICKCFFKKYTDKRHQQSKKHFKNNNLKLL